MVIANLLQDYVINKFFLNNLFFKTNYSNLYKYNDLIIKEVPQIKNYKNEFNILNQSYIVLLLLVIQFGY